MIERLGQFFKAHKYKTETPTKEVTLFDLKVGQVLSLDLEDWIVEGKVNYHQAPGWVWYELRSGTKQRALLLDRSIPDKALVMSTFAGRLDEVNEVKIEYVLDGKRYYLDYHGECEITVTGSAAVGNGPLMYWQFGTDQQEVYRIQWQRGRFLHYDGRWIDAFEVEVVT